MSTYADSLLSSGEQVIRRASQHPFVLLHAIGIFALTVLVGGLIFFGGGALASAIGGTTKDVIDKLVLGIGLLVLAFGFARLGLRWFEWRCEEYIVTNHRIMKVEGLINKRSADSSLEKINDAVLSQNLFGRIFGYGSLDIMTAAESTVDQFRMLRDPIGFKKAMLDAKSAYYAGGPANS